MRCWFAHRASAMLFLPPLGFCQGTSWHPRLVDYVVGRNVFTIEPEWGQFTVTVYAVLHWYWAQDIHTGRVVYVTGKVGQGKLFNRGVWIMVWVPKNLKWLAFFPPKHLSQLCYAVSFFQSAVHDPQTISLSAAGFIIRELYNSIHTQSFFSFNCITVKASENRPLLLYFIFYFNWIPAEITAL